MRAGRVMMLLLMAGAALPLAPLALAENDTPDVALSSAQASATLPIEDIQTFAEVFERIKRAYVDEVDDKTLLHNAMKGMLSGLDPHSAYMDAEAFRSLQEATQGEFGGLGIEVGMEDDRLTVIAPIDNTPAAKAGLQPHDTILSIDGTSTEGMSLEEAVKLLRGDAGTQVKLNIYRKGNDTPQEFTLTRANIRNESVSSKLLDPGYAYLRISQFQTRTAEQARAAIEKFKRQAPLKGLVLDLRNNPGGILQGAVDVSDLFLDDGLIVYTKGRLPDSQMRFSASQANSVDSQVPMVVLINGGTASAAEIVSGALQDHHRAIVMGTDSFGKGSVQTVLPLDNGEGLKLTTALYYTPSGRSIQAEGIEPDVGVQRGQLTLEPKESWMVREADLEGHLRNAEASQQQGEAPRSSPVAAQDYQLGEALNLLKGLNVIQRASQQTP